MRSTVSHWAALTIGHRTTIINLAVAAQTLASPRLATISSPFVHIVGIFLLSLTLFWCTTSHAASAKPSISINADSRSVDLGRHLSYLIEDNTLTLDDAQRLLGQKRFKNNNDDTLTLGYQETAVWLHVAVSPEASSDQHWVLALNDPLLDSAMLYVVDEQGQIQKQTSGERVPQSERAAQYRTPLFKITLTEQPYDLFIRLESADPIQLYDLSLKSTLAFAEDNNTEVLILGAYYGILSVMILYNFFILLSLRDRAYGYYVLYIAAMLVANLGFNGLASQYLWPESPWWANRALPFLSGLVAALGILFTRHFIETKQYSPMMDKALWVFLVLSLALMVSSVLLPYHLVVNHALFISLSYPLLIMATAVHCVIRKQANAPFFLLAWLMFIIGLIIRVGVAAGAIDANLATMYAAQIGSAVETILLSLALAARISRMRKEKMAIEQASKEALEKANRKLESNNRLKDNFLAMISHELRTPMNGINGMLEMMGGSSLNSDQKRYHQAAAQSALEMETHIERILNFTDAQANHKFPSRLEPVDIRELLEQLLRPFHNTCQQKYITLELDVHERVAQVIEADPYQLKHILRQLIDNAVKFTDAGHVKVYVECLGDKEAKQRLNIIVEDTGIGIPADQVDQIFKPFQQLEDTDTRRFGGLGIGLAICARLAKLHGARLNYRANTPKGCRFSLEIEAGVLQLKAEAQQSVAAIEAIENSNDNLHGKERVLIVEDNDVNRSLFDMFLRQEGYQVVGAVNGIDAMEKISQEAAFDVVVMDCQMPIMDGFETTRRIRDVSAHYQKIPIIAVTAYAMSGDRDKCLHAGMNDYLSKPVDRKTLATMLAKWLALPQQDVKPSARQETAPA